MIFVAAVLIALVGFELFKAFEVIEQAKNVFSEASAGTRQRRSK